MDQHIYRTLLTCAVTGGLSHLLSMQTFPVPHSILALLGGFGQKNKAVPLQPLAWAALGTEARGQCMARADGAPLKGLLRKARGSVSLLYHRD